MIKQNKTGLVFTLDAIFAIVIALSTFSAAFYYLNQISSTQHDDQNLIKLSMNSLTVLEKDGSLEYTIRTLNTNIVEQFLNNTEGNICANITVYNYADEPVKSIIKDNCNTTQTFNFAKRVFIANKSQVFYTTMETWYDEG
jgi:DUF1680 family protein